MTVRFLIDSIDKVEFKDDGIVELILLNSRNEHEFNELSVSYSVSGSESGLVLSKPLVNYCVDHYSKNEFDLDFLDTKMLTDDIKKHKDYKGMIEDEFHKTNEPRVLCHFSCGAPSAVATKLAIQKYGKERVTIINIHIKEEHPDNQRFLKDCEEWFGMPVTTVQNEKYNGSIYEVFKQGYLKGIYGAPCTTQLKRKVRESFQRDDDIHVFGFTLEEEQRAQDFNDRNEALATEWILIEQGINRNDCLGILQGVGIEIPMMYKLGYSNNNCQGCVKGGMGYWNKIRKDFPDVFARMAMTERGIGHAILKDKDGAVWLDELDPKRGRMSDEPDIECSLICTGTLNSF